MTKSKIIAGLFAALTLTATVIATGDAEARGRHHGAAAFGIGLAIGTVAAAAAASGAYAEPAYECHYVKRYNRWGEYRLVKICDRY